MNKETKKHLAAKVKYDEVAHITNLWLDGLEVLDVTGVTETLLHSKLLKAVAKYLRKKHKQGQKLNEKQSEATFAAYEAKRVKPVDTNLQ
jgi:hypothetical protein